MIAIIDYGMGNLRSVQKGLEKVGFEAQITDDTNVVENAQGVILPGVGAFSDAMDNLKAAGMVDSIQRVTAKGTPFLGICLGFQLIFDSSDEGCSAEDQPIKGLSLLPGMVKRFPANMGLKVPHMGWNALQIKQPKPLLEGIPQGSECYFVHSFYVEPGSDAFVAAACDYGMSFCAVVAQGNIFGTQFHPEKSSSIGLKILENFGRLVKLC